MSNSDREIFISEQAGPPRRRFFIVGEGPVTNNTEVSGWAFIVDETDEAGEWQPSRDTWEEFFFEILRYPPEYGPLVWREQATGKVVDINALQPFYDGKRVGPDETPESAGLRLPR